MLRRWNIGPLASAIIIAFALNGGCGNLTPGEDYVCREEPEHTGEATYREATGTGACSFDATPADQMIGAVNRVDFDGSSACGACARITGPAGEITVRIVDLCSECARGDIALSASAFTTIAPLESARAAISWEYVPCEVSGPVSYRFKEGSTERWTAVQIRDHRNRIAKVEYRSGDAYWAIPRRADNYFVLEAGMGPAPYTLRVTDVYGHVLTDSDLPGLAGATYAGTRQFLACAEQSAVVQALRAGENPGSRGRDSSTERDGATR